MHLNGMLGGSILASGLATRALFALLPGLLLLVAFVGFLVGDPAIQQAVLEFIADLFPPLESLIADSLTVISEGAVPFTIVGLIGLLWAASGFFQTLDVAFAVVLGIERRRDPVVRGVIGISGVALILAAVGLVVVVMLAAAAFAPQILARLMDPRFSQLAGTATLAVVAVIAVSLAYHFIPSVRPSWSAVLVPAVVIALGITLLTELFTIIAPFLAGTASLYGAIAAVFVLLAWLQICANLIVMGMVWIRIRVQGLPDVAGLPWPTGTLNHPAGAGAGGGDEVPKVPPAGA
jgi:membrane protein